MKVRLAGKSHNAFTCVLGSILSGAFTLNHSIKHVKLWQRGLPSMAVPITLHQRDEDSIPRPVRNCAFQVFRCAPPIVGTAPCGCPSSIIGISHGTAQGLSPTDPQNNPQFLPRINAIFPDAEYISHGFSDCNQKILKIFKYVKVKNIENIAYN